jgi:hypothetical protein
MQGTNTSYVQPGSQFSQQNIQRNAQQRVPFQGQFNGNPRGANNMGRRNNNPFGFQGQGMAPAWSQQNNLGRYRPPTMNGMGGYNSNQWNDMGGMDYNLPGSYGSPLGQGQFAPMPRQFQQFMMGGMGGGFGGVGLDRMRQQQMAGFGLGFPQITDMMVRDRSNQQGGDDWWAEYNSAANQFYRDRGLVDEQGVSTNPGNTEFFMSPEEWMRSRGRSGYMNATTDGRGQWVDTGGGMQVGNAFSPQQVQRSMQQTTSGFDPRAIGADPSGFRQWAQQALNQPGQDPQYAAQIRAQLSAMGTGAPEGKGGSPLMEQPQPAPTWDSPFNRSYNMAALRQMMGGG